MADDLHIKARSPKLGQRPLKKPAPVELGKDDDYVLVDDGATVPLSPPMNAAANGAGQVAYAKTDYALDKLFSNAKLRRRACRAGISAAQRRVVWFRLAQGGSADRKLADSYAQAVATAFQGRKPTTAIVPDYAGGLDLQPAELQEQNPFLRAGAAASQALKTLLCVLSFHNPDISHCPMLPDLAAVMLRIMSPGEVYQSLHRMLQRSRKDNFYFTTSGAAFARFNLVFRDLARRKVSRVAQFADALRAKEANGGAGDEKKGAAAAHERKQSAKKEKMNSADAAAAASDTAAAGIAAGASAQAGAAAVTTAAAGAAAAAQADVVPAKRTSLLATRATALAAEKGDLVALFACWHRRCFVNLLPPALVFRFVDAFLHEGYKVLFRVALAVLKLCERPVRQLCKNGHQLQLLLRHHVKNLPVDGVMRAGFRLRLVRSDIQRLVSGKSVGAGEVESGNMQFFYLPRFDEDESDILTTKQLYRLWAWLPPKLRIMDPRLAFATDRHGYDLNSLRAKAGRVSPVLLVIKDTDGSIFGAFTGRPWVRMPDQHRGGAEAAGGGGGAAPEQTDLTIDGSSFVFRLEPEAAAAAWHAVPEQEQEAAISRWVQACEVRKAVDAPPLSVDAEGKQDEQLRLALDAGSAAASFQMCSKHMLALGDRRGCALSLDADLKLGVSAPTVVFGNEPLLGPPRIGAHEKKSKSGKGGTPAAGAAAATDKGRAAAVVARARAEELAKKTERSFSAVSVEVWTFQMAS